ncbi:cysteine hydrolase family protein [Colletotrichum kahawae]|uniref:Cysteine hydrolase family protein n=1 Tax=Colletotrichum kahawae TaxID=34407 RepID=A0AAD9YPU0_COLKA|nr:cysteine hydrolase family protein [Colletotrichum kahawae]
MVGAQATGGGAPSFGKRFAILNIDLMALMFDSIKETDEGKLFTSNCVRWNEAVHQHQPRPLTIFTTLCFTNASQPELARPSPFSSLIDGFGDFVKGSPGVQIDERLKLDEKDIVLHKTRWYAGAGNALEQILRAQVSRARARPRSPALPEQLPRSGSAGSTILPWHTA